MKKLLMGSFSALAAFAFADRADSLSAAAYVQNGLVAQFDAIENAGVGVHDASATSWTDLKGSAVINLQGGAS